MEGGGLGGYEQGEGAEDDDDNIKGEDVGYSKRKEQDHGQYTDPRHDQLATAFHNP